MAIATDRLHTIVTLDAANYQANSAKVVAATAKMKAAGVGDGSVFRNMGSVGASALGAVGTIATAAAAGIAVVGAAMIQLGSSSLQAYGNLERLTLGLTAVEGSAEVAAERLKQLRELAKAPGLGFSEAVGAFGMLRNAGASAGFSQEIIKQFANANARGGGDSATFQRILQAVAQSLNAPFLQGDEMRQFRENRLPVDAALKSRFGTSDSEELKRQGVTSAMAIQAIADEFSKMPRVAGGLTNAFENLTDTINLSLAEIGKGLAPGVMLIVDQISGAFSELTDSGVLDLFGRTLARVGNEVSAAFSNAQGGRSLAEIFIDVGAAAIDLTTVLGNIATGFISVASAIPGLNGIAPLLNALSGGAGAQFKAEALAALAQGNINKPLDVGSWARPEVQAPATNPVQQRQLVAQEAIAKNTAELVRFEQSALGGGDLLRRGISVSDANRFNAGKGSSSNARDNLVSAIEALIAQNVARSMA